ncbi:hypothetical protein BN381_90074 [Candidatus Microthrix parvicella RN1]|uniref:Uncharacterized protein n=1 Tax=Candidatus Neomicrothrix parvicella RN1 TaxID=1229780 RepID=R4Z5H7_9ACTN|nr:hypothetical protein BN381_90074 [Candidatus Microthrix parvicella RN1]
MRDVDAVGGVGHDVVGFAFPAQQIGVGHAHHRQVLVALAATVAGAGTAFLPGPQQIPHEIGQHAVFDQHVALGGTALIVDGEGTPFAAHRAVVNQRHQRRGHLLTHTPGKDRRRLPNQIGLQAVAARLVEHHATTPRTDHHGAGARWRRTGVQLDDRPAGGTLGQLLHAVVVKQLKSDRVADALASGLHAGVAVGHRRHRKQRAYLVVGRQHTIGVGHLNTAPAVPVAGRNLTDRRSGRPGRAIGPTEQFHLGAGGHVAREQAHHRRVGRLHRRELHHGGAALAVAGSGSGSAGCCIQALGAQVGGVGETRGFPHHHPNSGAPVATGGHILHPAVVEDRRGGTSILHEHLGKLGTAGQAGGQNLGQGGLFNHGRCSRSGAEQGEQSNLPLATPGPPALGARSGAVAGLVPAGGFGHIPGTAG